MLKQPGDLLSSIDFSAFLAKGCLLENPINHTLIVGLIEDSSEVSNIFSINFYGAKRNFRLVKYVETSRLAFFQWVQAHGGVTPKLEFVETGDEAYFEDVKSCLYFFENNQQLKKLVPTSFAKFHKTHEHPLFFLHKMTHLQGSLFGLWSDKEGMIGITPEVLLQNNGDHFETMSLAGTISTDIENYTNILLESDKNQTEQDFVTKDIEEKLQNHAKDIEISHKEVFNFGPIAHLKNTIRFKSEDNFQTLCSLLSPTAALGGYPSNIAKEYLQKMKNYNLEGTERSFGGVIGVDLIEAKYALVCIRSIEWKNNDIYIHSGTGVVADSIPELELAEIHKKRSSLLDNIL